jgi:presenilin 1
VESDGEINQSKCGLAACGKKLLSVLPYIGDDEDENSDADFEVLRQGAKQIIQLIVPVTLCMAVVVIFELSIVLQEQENNEYFVYTPFNENEASSGGQTFLFALINALIVVAIVVVMTVILVCLFKYRCYRVSLYLY